MNISWQCKLTLPYVGMGAILPCLLGVLSLLYGVGFTTRSALPASASVFCLVRYTCHSVERIERLLSYLVVDQRS
jgi:hypothetical protein